MNSSSSPTGCRYSSSKPELLELAQPLGEPTWVGRDEHVACDLLRRDVRVAVLELLWQLELPRELVGRQLLRHLLDATASAVSSSWAHDRCTCKCSFPRPPAFLYAAMTLRRSRAAGSP